MKEFNILANDEPIRDPHHIIHLKGDSNDYTVSSTPSESVYESDNYKYIIPAGEGDEITFEKVEGDSVPSIKINTP